VVARIINRASRLTRHRRRYLPLEKFDFGEKVDKLQDSSEDYEQGVVQRGAMRGRVSLCGSQRKPSSKGPVFSLKVARYVWINALQRINFSKELLGKEGLKDLRFSQERKFLVLSQPRREVGTITKHQRNTALKAIASARIRSRSLFRKLSGGEWNLKGHLGYWLDLKRGSSGSTDASIMFCIMLCYALKEKGCFHFNAGSSCSSPLSENIDAAWLWPGVTKISDRPCLTGFCRWEKPRIYTFLYAYASIEPRSWLRKCISTAVSAYVALFIWSEG